MVTVDLPCNQCDPTFSNLPREALHRTPPSSRVLITFLVVILVLYLINMLPIDGRAKQIVRVIGDHRRRAVPLLQYLVTF